MVDNDVTEELKYTPTRSGRGSRVVPAVAATSMVVSTNDEESEYEEPLAGAATGTGTERDTPEEVWPAGLLLPSGQVQAEDVDYGMLDL